MRLATAVHQFLFPCIPHAVCQCMAALYTSTQLHMQLVLPHAADICAYRTRRPGAPFPWPNSCVLDQPLASMLEDLACSKAGLQQDCNFSAGSCDVACPAEAWAAQAALSLSQQTAAVVAPSNRNLAVLPWQASIIVCFLKCELALVRHSRLRLR